MYERVCFIEGFKETFRRALSSIRPVPDQIVASITRQLADLGKPTGDEIAAAVRAGCLACLQYLDELIDDLVVAANRAADKEFEDQPRWKD